MMAISENMKELPLHKFFIFELEDLYWAEQHILESMPKMIDAATSEALRSGLNNHLQETTEHITRLKQAFETLGEKPRDTKCKAIAGILKEVDDMIAETKKGSAVRDAAIIMAAQKVEHYEITSYGSMIAFSKLMGHNQVTALLQDTLREEDNTNSTLTSLAEGGINEQALKEK